MSHYLSSPVSLVCESRGFILESPCISAPYLNNALGPPAFLEILFAPRFKLPPVSIRRSRLRDRQISVYLLRAKEASVNQLAQELKITSQAVYHHIRKLLDAGMAEGAKEGRVGHIVESYCRATAEVFYYSHGEGSPQQEEDRAKDALQALNRLGYPIQVDDELVSKIVKLSRRHAVLELKPEMEEKFAGIDDLSFLTKNDLSDFVKFLTMTDKQFDEHVSIQKQLRELLKSSLSSRNPIYLSGIIILLGVAVAANALWLIILLPLGLFLISLQIKREEEYLEAKFGDEYRIYKGRVRRWL